MNETFRCFETDAFLWDLYMHHQGIIKYSTFCMGHLLAALWVSANSEEVTNFISTPNSATICACTYRPLAQE